MQVSGVSDFFRSVLDCVLLLLSRLQLLDRLGNQLVGDFGVSGYTRKKYAMHETHERMQCNAVNIQEGMDKTDNNSPNYGSKEMVQR